MRDRLLALVGPQGYRHLLTVMYNPDILCAAGIAPTLIARLGTYLTAHAVETVPRHEMRLESDSKSPIYVVHTRFDNGEGFYLVVKWYAGKRAPIATTEQCMNGYFRRCLATRRPVGRLLTVVSLGTAEPLQVAIFPYLGDTTLYDALHRMPPYSPQVEALLRHASETLAYTQVLGRQGHEEQAIHLTSLTPETAPGYFLQQIDSVLNHTFAAGGQPLPMAATLLQQLAFFATLLGTDSCTAGLYYRGINPRNIMCLDGQQIEIDFEQDTLRSRFIDIVSLLENGLEMTAWDATADYPAFDAGQAFPAWEARRQRALTVLAQYNCLTLQQVETLTAEFVATTLRLEQQALATPAPAYGVAEYHLLLETARLFRHLQYVGYCKRNELQARTDGKRLSSRYRQQFHALWAKCALDSLLYPHGADCLPREGREAALALRRTLDTLASNLKWSAGTTIMPATAFP
jgi:hypothetical protein